MKTAVNKINNFIKKNKNEINELANLKELAKRQQAFEEKLNNAILSNGKYAEVADYYLLDDDLFFMFLKERYEAAKKLAPLYNLTIEAENYEFDLFYKTEQKIRDLENKLWKAFLKSLNLDYTPNYKVKEQFIDTIITGVQFF